MRQGSDGSLPTTVGGDAASFMTGRQESTSGPGGARPASPASIAASTMTSAPGPSSEVTPWEFQDSEVSATVFIPESPTMAPVNEVRLARR